MLIVLGIQSFLSAGIDVIIKYLLNTTFQVAHVARHRKILILVNVPKLPPCLYLPYLKVDFILDHYKLLFAIHLFSIKAYSLSFLGQAESCR